MEKVADARRWTHWTDNYFVASANLRSIVAKRQSMWRVIVRISYFRDAGSQLRNNHVAPFFAALGLQNTATGTFESPAVDRIQAANQRSQVLQAVANPQQFPEVHALAALKHLWVYIDQAHVSAAS
ncbi:MAG TPA: hypothetical protein VHX65_20325 [Pirellulales bacterium]|jgi:hypothetical protein|nr:hypothetical protein [Pirellulales bacterium]